METVRIIYVCDANTARSPAAAAITNTIAERDGLNIEASSAGLGRSRSKDVVSEMKQAIMDLGYPRVTGHTPTILTLEELAGLTRRDYIFCFEKTQKLDITQLAKQVGMPILPTKIGLPRREIRDPDCRIRDTLYTSTIARVPWYPVRKIFYNIGGGCVYKEDYWMIREAVYYKTARQIEAYVKQVIEQIKRDNL